MLHQKYFPSFFFFLTFLLLIACEIYIELKWEELTYCCDDISIPVDSLSFACCSSLYLILFYDFKKWSVLMLLLLHLNFQLFRRRRRSLDEGMKLFIKFTSLFIWCVCVCVGNIKSSFDCNISSSYSRGSFFWVAIKSVICTLREKKTSLLLQCETYEKVI